MRFETFPLAIALALSATLASAQKSRLEIRNDSDSRITVFAKPASNPRAPWARLEIGASKAKAFDLTGDDLFNLRVYVYFDDGTSVNLGVDDLDVHALSDTPGEYGLILRHWTTNDGFRDISHFPYPVIGSIPLSSDGRSLRLNFPGLVGHRPNKPKVLP